MHSVFFSVSVLPWVVADSPASFKPEFCRMADSSESLRTSDRIGPVVGQLVGAVRYKPEGREFNCHWNLIDIVLQAVLWP